MKKVLLAAMLGLIIIFNSCSSIPDKSIMQKLSTEELAKAVKSDTAFADFYQGIGARVDTMNDIKKAKFNEITYRRLFKFAKFIVDTTYWKSLDAKWDEEWRKQYSNDLAKYDSTMKYWRQYMKEHSLDKQVKIECIDFKREFYQYIDGIKDICLGFSITPLQGPIDYVSFTYSIKPKNNNIKTIIVPNKAISSRRISDPTKGYWAVSIIDEKLFSGLDVQTFLRDYDVIVDISSIIKNGTVLSVDDLPVPKSVREYFNDEKVDSSSLGSKQAEIIQELIDKNFVSKKTFRSKNAEKEREKNDKLCNEFISYIF